MEWLTFLAFMGTWYLAGKEVEKLQTKQRELEDQLNGALKSIDELQRTVDGMGKEDVAF